MYCNDQAFTLHDGHKKVQTDEVVRVFSREDVGGKYLVIWPQAITNEIFLYLEDKTLWLEYIAADGKQHKVALAEV